MWQAYDRSGFRILTASVDMALYSVSAIFAHGIAYVFFYSVNTGFQALPIYSSTGVCISALLPFSEALVNYMLRPKDNEVLFKPFSQVYNAILSFAVTYPVFLLISAFLLGGYKEFAVLWISVGSLLGTVAVCLKNLIGALIMKRFRRGAQIIRTVAAIGNSRELISALSHAISQGGGGEVMLIGYVSASDLHIADVEYLGAPDGLSRFLGTETVTDAVLVYDDIREAPIDDILRICTENQVKLSVMPELYSVLSAHGTAESICGIGVVNAAEYPKKMPVYDFLKRAIDIFTALILLIFTMPVMLAAAIGIKLTSKGPVIFKQKRVGKDGRIITVPKLRTMWVNSKSETGWSTSSDTRKTRFGSFLRKYAIDELPQLFTVLIGKMSMVGPRPETVHFVGEFNRTLPGYMLRHAVKPGITGLSQIKRLRGDTSITERLKYDIDYIKKRSTVFDLAIMIKTPFCMINSAEKYTSPPSGAEKPQEHGRESGKGRLIYAASTMSHIRSFHMPYIEALRSEGWQVAVMARGDGADFDIPFEKKLLSSVNSACRGMIRAAVKEYKPDVVLLNTALASFHIRLSLRGEDRPRAVNIVHGYLFSRAESLIRNIVFISAEKFTARKTDALIVMNRTDEAAARKYGLCNGRVFFIHGMGVNMLHGGKSIGKKRGEYGCSDKFIMTFAGELSRRKNQRFLIYALSYLKEQIPSAVLWLLGDGDALYELRELAKKLGLASSVYFIGLTDSVADYLVDTDLYVSASLTEGMPFNIIEALGCGCTVLASRIKGHEDIIDDGYDGFLYESGSLRSFADKALCIYNEKIKIPPERAVLKYEKYSISRTFKNTLRVIQEATGKYGNDS